MADFYKTHNNSLIVVPEIDNPQMPCRFEYIAHCSEKINQSMIKKLEQRISMLMDNPFILFKDKCNVKNPGGGAFPPHQDFSAYQHFFPKFHVTAAVMLDDSTIENGCLEVASNYKKYKKVLHSDIQQIKCSFGIFPFFDFYQGGKNNGDIKSELSDQLAWLPVEAKKGDVLLFHSFLPHCSKKNNSKNARRNFFFTFNALSEGNWYQHYYEIKRNQFNNPMFHVSTPTQHQTRALMENSNEK